MIPPIHSQNLAGDIRILDKKQHRPGHIFGLPGCPQRQAVDQALPLLERQILGRQDQPRRNRVDPHRRGQRARQQAGERLERGLADNIGRVAGPGFMRARYR